MTARLVCARCHRRLVRAAATLHGLPLGPDCARIMADAVRASPTPIERAADREAAARAADFAARQLSFLEA